MPLKATRLGRVQQRKDAEAVTHDPTTKPDL